MIGIPYLCGNSFFGYISYTKAIHDLAYCTNWINFAQYSEEDAKKNVHMKLCTFQGNSIHGRLLMGSSCTLSIHCGMATSSNELLYYAAIAKDAEFCSIYKLTLVIQTGPEGNPNRNMCRNIVDRNIPICWLAMELHSQHAVFRVWNSSPSLFNAKFMPQ